MYRFNGSAFRTRDIALRQGGMTQFQDKPVLDRDLHPGAHVRDDLRREVQPEVAVAQSGQGSTLTSLRWESG